jgi:hypothetical protein
MLKPTMKATHETHKRHKLKSPKKHPVRTSRQSEAMFGNKMAEKIRKQAVEPLSASQIAVDDINELHLAETALDWGFQLESIIPIARDECGVWELFAPEPIIFSSTLVTH